MYSYIPSALQCTECPSSVSYILTQPGLIFTAPKNESDQAHFVVCNSSLSKFGTLGFELNHSLILPDALTIWRRNSATLRTTRSALYKPELGKNVPHRAKGHDLLDLLQSYDVAIFRVVWFLRVFGGRERIRLRNKMGYNPSQYSIEWANLQRSALSSCLELLRTFYAEGLAVNRTFLAWLVQQMGTCNLAQLGFVARLADEYIDGMLINRALTHHFIDAGLNRLKEHSFLALPDAFVGPRVWQLHSELLGEILSTAIAPAEGTPPQNTQALQQTLQLQELFKALQTSQAPKRGHAIPPLASPRLWEASPQRFRISSVFFLEDASIPHPWFARKLDILLIWSVTSLVALYEDYLRSGSTTAFESWVHVAAKDGQYQGHRLDSLRRSRKNAKKLSELREVTDNVLTGGDASRRGANSQGFRELCEDGDCPRVVGLIYVDTLGNVKSAPTPPEFLAREPEAYDRAGSARTTGRLAASFTYLTFMASSDGYNLNIREQRKFLSHSRWSHIQLTGYPPLVRSLGFTPFERPVATVDVLSTILSAIHPLRTASYGICRLLWPLREAE
ncbi:uncharacterized protein B0H18DRAFT_1197644 [Fomitopsis serialis]|uniref:uncharacterized protein n=1 Tax=Fomitopsis serialis TaxID=139415 RepID=UPI0020089AB2|nr:uncharacterized protein B0H18DRAFT_1197644 [Neoantrodia serialis]KAH9919005.1 hypothetical protein B0H18DRAFT_1197644 [Neoantrodia serialis]